jgi:cytochrome c biogenesis protein
MSTVEAPPADRVDEPLPPSSHGFGPWLAALLRRGWRQLTSMRTALVLLFLLAIAAIPGSLLPQRNVGIEKVDGYLRTHGATGRWLDRFYLFDVFTSPWFSAIYLLLFVSLVGCLVPRLRTQAVALIRPPVAAPARLDRMPAYATGTSGDVAALAALLRKRRFRVAVRGDAVSAEKGYLKESGNLLFHFALLGLLIGVAVGALYGWHGNRLLVAGPEQAYCNSLQQYDESGLGARVSATDLPPYCVQLDDFDVSYLDSGQPTSFDATVTYTDGGRAARRAHVSVNHPLELTGANFYLLGHGYAPVLRYTDRFGNVQTSVSPFLTSEQRYLTSEGVATFPDANVDPATGRRDPKAQVAFAGRYLPTMSDDVHQPNSVFPAERNPRLFLVAYVGNLGMDTGRAQSVYSLDQSQIDAGKLSEVAVSKGLKKGETWTLPDGSKVEFLGTRPWITTTSRHDPGELTVLVGAVCLLVGLLLSLTGKRRRIWFRVGPERTEAAALPRTDYAGFQAEFDDIVQAARKEGIL